VRRGQPNVFANSVVGVAAGVRYRTPTSAPPLPSSPPRERAGVGARVCVSLGRAGGSQEAMPQARDSVAQLRRSIVTGRRCAVGVLNSWRLIARNREQAVDHPWETAPPSRVTIAPIDRFAARRVPIIEGPAAMASTPLDFEACILVTISASSGGQDVSQDYGATGHEQSEQVLHGTSAASARGLFSAHARHRASSSGLVRAGGGGQHGHNNLSFWVPRACDVHG
jgi:hypothetical protein